MRCINERSDIERRVLEVPSFVIMCGKYICVQNTFILVFIG